MSTFSRKSTDPQLKYNITKKEFLASHKACKYFHHIMYGCEVRIHSHHLKLQSKHARHINGSILNIIWNWIKLTKSNSITLQEKRIQEQMVQVDYLYMTERQPFLYCQRSKKSQHQPEHKCMLIWAKYVP